MYKDGPRTDLHGIKTQNKIAIYKDDYFILVRRVGFEPT